MAAIVREKVKGSGARNLQSPTTDTDDKKRQFAPHRGGKLKNKVITNRNLSYI